MLRIVFGMLLISSFGEGFSQKFIYFPTWDTDSLLEILPGQTGEGRVNSLNKLATSLSYIDQDSSIMYTDEALGISKQIGYDKGIARAYVIHGFNQVFTGNYPECVKYYLKAIQLYDKLGLEKSKASVHSHIAFVNYYARNYENAIHNCNKALSIYRRENENESIIWPVKDTMSIYQQLALCYYLSGSCDKSLNLTLKYLDVGRENNFDRTDLFFNLILAGERYSCIGEQDSALVYLNRALAFPNENQNIITLKYRAYSALGKMYYRKGPEKQDSAIIWFEEAYKYYNTRGFLFWASNVAETLGLVYYLRNQFDTAQLYFHSAEGLINEMLEKQSWYRHDSIMHIVTWGMKLYVPMPPDFLKQLMWRNASSVYNYLYRINDVLGNADNALRYHIAYSNANDTVNKIRKSEEILRLQTSFETERYKGQIESLAQENAIQSLKLKQSGYLMFGLLALVVVIILAAVFIVRINKLKGQRQTLLLQQKLFRSQMNPHFIFNSLASIQNFVVKQDSMKANIYLSRFSELVRSILDSSAEEYITFEKEVNTIENYLELQKVRFPEKFNYSIDVDESIDPENMMIPPMLAQPFIENSIEHGFKRKLTRGKIKIGFSMKSKLIVFEVEDDGIGREKAQEIGYKINKDHRSMATDITRERLMVLNKKLRQKITLVISDLKNERNQPTGTMVVFDIPFKYV